MQAQGSYLPINMLKDYIKKDIGVEFVDEIEELAIQRVKKLFNANWANVQPHSGLMQMLLFS